MKASRFDTAPPTAQRRRSDRLRPRSPAAAFNPLETARFEELAPVGALQTMLARRIVAAAWRLERADRMEAEVLEFRSYAGADPGLALIRDCNAAARSRH